MADPGDKYEAFRAEVEPVYFERFKRDLGTAESEIQAAVNLDSKTLTGVVKWHTWKLEKLHARVVGTNGQSSVQTNIQVNANGSIEIKQMSHEELLELAK